MTPRGFRTALLHAAAAQDIARMDRLSRAQGWAVTRAAARSAFAAFVRALVVARCWRTTAK